MKIKYRNSDGFIKVLGSIPEPTPETGYSIDEVDLSPVPQIYKYKYVGGAIVPKTAQELQDTLDELYPDKADFKTSPFSNVTPAQAETWIENNVSDLASAKTALKKIAKVVIYLVNQAKLNG